MPKVLLLNGSPRAHECTATALEEMIKVFQEEGMMIACLDRLFFSTPFSKHMKVGAAVVSCRRGGNTASFDVLNKYFTISGMPVASSTYWNQVHGHNADDAKKDLEGLQTMRNLARNMSFMIRAFSDAKEKYGLPQVEREFFTSFSDGK